MTSLRFRERFTTLINIYIFETAEITLLVKAGANRTTCWPTFRPTSADQHVGQQIRKNGLK